MENNSELAPPIMNGHGETRRSTQLKRSNGGWNSAIFIIFVEVAERFAFYGVSGNLITYLTNEMGESTATAAKNVNTWSGVSFTFPLIGGFIADSYLGRFRTIITASFIYIMGMVLLILSVTIVPLSYRKAVFFTALYIIVIGEGGHKPCVQTFAADQFDDDSPDGKKAKSSFFNWWFLGIMAGGSFANLLTAYVQDNVSWAAGFGMLLGALTFALALFLMGIKKYKKQGPLGSPFATVAQVLVTSVRNRHLEETADGGGICYGDEKGSVIADDQYDQPTVRTLARTNQFRFLDKAMIIDKDDAYSQIRNRWRLCSLNQVEKVKLVLRLIPIWLSCLMFTVVQAQVQTYFTKQGSTLERSIGSHFRIPPASLQGVVGLTVLITVPLYARVLVPMARRFTGHLSGITMLQRIGIGLFLSVINMLCSGAVETKRVRLAIENNLLDSPKSTIPMSILWLLPQYVICGLSDTFAVVGLQELFYDQMPEEMRSLGAAAFVSILGTGFFLSSAVISIVQSISSRCGEKWLHGDNLNKAHLNYFYWVLAALGALNLCVYVCIASRFVYKKVEGEEARLADEQKKLSLEDAVSMLKNKMCARVQTS